MIDSGAGEIRFVDRDSRGAETTRLPDLSQTPLHARVRIAHPAASGNRVWAALARAGGTVSILRGGN